MINKLINNFTSTIKSEYIPPKQYFLELEKLLASYDSEYTINPVFSSKIFEAINNKLDTNKQTYKKILDQAFIENVKFNYHQKNLIINYLNSRNQQAYYNLLESLNVPNDSLLYKTFEPISDKKAILILQELISDSSKKQEILDAIFARYIFNLFDLNFLHQFFAEEKVKENNFIDFIGTKYPDLINRKNTLMCLDINDNWFEKDYLSGINKIYSSIRDSYYTLSNYSTFAVYIPNIILNSTSIQWKIYKDVVLFSEKFIETKLKAGYFKPDLIKQITSDYVKRELNLDFNIVNQGFFYKDTFILGEGDTSDYSLLLIFEKNAKDERIINCPACWSKHVRGNSYPALNVKSWECKNPLCPEKSKYNRGKRYSFESVLKQEFIKNTQNNIDPILLKKWRLDCQYNTNKFDALEMIIKFYSAENDGISIISIENTEAFSKLNKFNRNLKCLKPSNSKVDLYHEFHNSDWFKKYMLQNYHRGSLKEASKIDKATIYCGNALDVLHVLKNDSISAIVTSPPYYNAKEYSNWPNIYCFLYDIYNIALELFRTLKDGSSMLFNIFDYFDNEKIIAQSAMGNKRMILGAYMLDIFEKIGFRIDGNIIWDKGEIQGNRNFNQGNLGPYYQSPLNCWEHIFILSKNKTSNTIKLHSNIIQLHPVVKMVKGKNILGHTAPYPSKIPSMIIKYLNTNDTVLDPFLGSGTTCVVANSFGVNSIGIELNENYYTLCKNVIKESANEQLNLFNF